MGDFRAAIDMILHEGNYPWACQEVALSMWSRGFLPWGQGQGLTAREELQGARRASP